MKKLIVSLFAVALLPIALAHAQSAPSQQAQPLDRIAAVVNEDVILQSELDRAVGNILAQYANRQDQLPPREVLHRQVLERLVLVRLQAARAAESGIRVTDEEVDAAVNNVVRQNNITLDQLRQQLASGGTSFNDFRSSLRDELIIQRLRQSFAQSRISVSDGEVDAALAAQAAGGVQYRLAHILVALPEGATPEQIATAQQKIDGVKNLLDKGEMDFAAAAVRYSDSPNALEGGELGWRSTDEIPAAFASTIRTMQVGQVIGPTRGPSGFQLLKLVETRDAAAGAAGAASNVTQYQARHILVRTGSTGTGATVSDAQAKAKIETLRARIDGGAEFTAVASENSDDVGSRAKGGDLGWFTQDEFGPEFGTQVAGLQDGQVSAPFKTQAGWHIVQRIGTRQADASNDNRRAQVRESIGQRKLEDEWNRYLRELRGEAFVDIRNGNAPADESQAETPAASGG
jgi:peptidyl-prolyl cis-trans isomerase SurA